MLWDLAERGRDDDASARARRYIAACMKAGVEPAEGRDLSALRAVGSTGSPLSPEGFEWVYDQLGAETWLFSTSGGTDVCTAFVGGVPTLPVYLGELQARSLGATVESWDEDGRAARSARSASSCITEPMPSMPIFFWGDEDGSRLRESYFEMYPGVWRHGDWIEITDARDGDHLRPLGLDDQPRRRSGWARARSTARCSSLDEIIDALVVDVPREGTDGWMPLFVVLREGAELDDDLIKQIAQADPRGLLAAPRAQRGPRDRRGAADAVGQGARGAGQADPDGRRRPTRPRAASRSRTPRRSTTSSTSRSAPTRPADRRRPPRALRPGAREGDEERACAGRAARDGDRGPPAGPRGAAAALGQT